MMTVHSQLGRGVPGWREIQATGSFFYAPLGINFKPGIGPYGVTL